MAGNTTRLIWIQLAFTTFLLSYSECIDFNNFDPEALQNIADEYFGDGDEGTHFDEDKIRDTLEDIKDRVHDFVTSPSYDTYGNIVIDKLTDLLKHVDKRTIKLMLDVTQVALKNPELASKMYERMHKVRQKQMTEAIRKGDMKLVTEWITNLTTSKNPMDIVKKTLESIGLGKAANAPKKSKFSESTKEEL